MATFKELGPSDVKTTKSHINQLIDIIQEDVSGSNTRRKYQVFVTGGVGPGVTSSLFQTVYDQDFSLPTANPIFDVTVGLWHTCSTVVQAQTDADSSGKKLFESSSLMMREKINNYRQFAQLLLGDATARFVSPFGTDVGDGSQLDSTSYPWNQAAINEALFISFKRLFVRDQVKRETFAMKFYQSASKAPIAFASVTDDADDSGGDILGARADAGGGIGPNVAETTESGSVVFTDAGAATNKETSHGGQVSNIVDASDTSRKVGLMFNDHGIAVFDLAKIISGSQHVSGVIDAMSSNAMPNGGGIPAGKTIVGHIDTETPTAKFIPDFMVSASIDNIIDHVCETRFSSGTLTAMTFQNITNVNSTLFFCRASADEFNYSSNPTYVDSENNIQVIDTGQEDTQRSFTFVTSVGLYDANDQLLAVAKLSRPVEKNDEKDVTFRIRLDY
jgi:hypothetical protein